MKVVSTTLTDIKLVLCTYYTKWPNEKKRNKRAYNQSYIFFYLKQCHFWKRCLPAISILSTSHAIIMKFTTRKSRQATSFQSAFNLCDILQCPIKSNFHSYRTIIHYIYWNMKSSWQVCFINIRLFSRILFKNWFYWYIRNFLQGVKIKILYFQ